MAVTHNHYTRTGAFFRWEMAVKYSRYKFISVVSILKRLRGGRFASETAVSGDKYPRTAYEYGNHVHICA
jgi:hypothetical protein